MKRADIVRYQQAARKVLSAAGIPLAPGAEIEIADFGQGRFEQLGLALVVRVNEPEYCSKWLVLLPGQKCPAHHHSLGQTSVGRWPAAGQRSSAGSGQEGNVLRPLRARHHAHWWRW